MQNQGIYGGPKFKRGHSSATDGFLTITHPPLNPHTDVTASGRISVEVRQGQARYTGKGRSPSNDATYAAACVYGPDGRCVGQLEPLQYI
jgi:hypothetical protein